MRRFLPMPAWGPCALLALSSLASAQSDPERHASAHVPARPARAPTFVLGHVFTEAGVPAAGAVVTSSVGGSVECAPDGSFELELALPRGAEAIELVATLEEDGRRLRLGVPLEIARPQGANEAGVLTLGAADDCLPHWQSTFGALPGTDQAILAVETFDLGDGPELLVGGLFQNAGSTGASYLARWNGTRWAGVPGSADGTVNVLRKIDLGGGPMLYAGGEFSRLGGTARGIARWNGTSWDSLGAGFNQEVHAFTGFDDGTGLALYAAGEFTSSGGVAVAHVARWNGTSWTPLGSGLDATTYALAVFDDGRGPALYASGNFTSAGGVPANRIARWDGTSWEALAGGLSAPGWTLDVFDDGNGPALYVGGPFVGPGSRIARWDGTSWSGVGGGVGSSVDGIRVLDDGSGPALYVAGRFATAGGMTAMRVARWDGASWTALGEGVDGGLGTTSGLVIHDDGTGPALVVTGSFTRAGGLAVSNVARWDGARWSALGGGPTGAVFAQAAYDDGSGAGHALYAGGFLTVGGTSARNIARWNGAEWSSLGPTPGPTVVPLALAVFDDGSGEALYAGGSFTQAGGGPGNNIARWDGTSWSPLGNGTTALVRTLAVFDDGSGPALYVGGDFGSVRRWNAGGWSGIGALGVSGTHALTQVVHDDGSGPALYVGGRFTRAAGQDAANVARWDGMRWSSLGSGTNDDVQALASFDDGSGPVLIAAGRFTMAGGAPANRVARWDGTQWSPLGNGLNGAVLALTVFDDRGPDGPALYAGGDFRMGGTLGVNRVARWNGERWRPLGRGVSAAVQSLFVFDDGLRSPPALSVGGFFTNALDSDDSFLALWQGWSCADVEAPMLLCPTSVMVDDPGAPGEVVTFEVTATDELDPAPIVVCIPPSGSTFPPGLTIVQCKATDASGNSAECSFPVVVGGAARRR